MQAILDLVPQRGLPQAFLDTRRYIGLRRVDYSARAPRVVRSAIVYARLAIGGAFLSAVGARFGLWDGTLDLEHFPRFIQLTAEVNSFRPAATIPFLAWAATVAELSLGLALIAGFHTRAAAFGAAVLLGLFGTAMAVSNGIKEPMDYSVFSASAGALLLALSQGIPTRTRANGDANHAEANVDDLT